MYRPFNIPLRVPYHSVPLQSLRIRLVHGSNWRSHGPSHLHRACLGACNRSSNGVSAQPPVTIVALRPRRHKDQAGRQTLSTRHISSADSSPTANTELAGSLRDVAIAD
jgi:hypothetical protein